MKRITVAVVFFVVCLISVFVVGAVGQFSDYFDTKDSILIAGENIEGLKSEIRQLDEEFSSMKSEEVPRDLQGIMAYFSEFEDLEINSIRAFTLGDAGTLNFVKNITNPKDPTLCDGYEINLGVSDILGFISYFDESQISYHSIDLLFGAENIILRVRTGGGI